MIRTLVLATLLAAPALAAADDNVRVATAIVPLDKKVTEDQCLAKAKAALTSAGMGHVGPLTHAMAGGKPDWSVEIDCLQSYGASVAHVSVGAHAKTADDLVKLLTQVTSALQK